MKKKLVTSYIAGIVDQEHGESCSTILGYFVPEFITALVLYSLLYLIDAWWIADLKSTSAYATVGVTNTLLHFIMKIAEAFSVGAVVTSGHYNGVGNTKAVGKALGEAFWVTVLGGGTVAALLFFGAYPIYYIYGVPAKMISLGVPFLRLRAVSIFLMFVHFAFVGFLRGIKQPRIHMQIFLVGAALFLFFDYALIFGKFGMPEMRLQGSALAAIIQYGVMLMLVLAYLLYDKNMRPYSINLLEPIQSMQGMRELLRISWPVMLDKGTLAASYLWLGAMINPMGKYAIASYTVIKDLERLAIQPAAAFAQVITFIVSNAYGRQDWYGIKSGIKKTVFLSSIFVFTILFILSLWPERFIQFFDQKGKFTAFSAKIFPVLSILVFFDLLQLILSGALRGAGDVRTVMWVRLSVCLFYFVPTSWLLAHLPIENVMLKFLIVYSSFYIGNALMSVIYINRFRGERWQHKMTLT